MIWSDAVQLDTKFKAKPHSPYLPTETKRLEYTLTKVPAKYNVASTRDRKIIPKGLNTE